MPAQGHPSLRKRRSAKEIIHDIPRALATQMPARPARSSGRRSGTAIQTVEAMPTSYEAMIALPDRLITKRELCQMVPYTPQHVLRLEKKGKFPRRIQVGPNRVAWLLSEVEAWISDRVAERN